MKANVWAFFSKSYLVAACGRLLRTCQDKRTLECFYSFEKPKDSLSLFVGDRMVSSELKDKGVL